MFMRSTRIALAFALALSALATTARADLANGEQIVKNVCASCHGFPPQGGPNFAPNNPSLIQFALNTIPAMSFLRATITPSDVNDIAAYLGVLFGTTTPPPPPPPPDSYQGLWLKFPFESESGWGINFSHQGTTLFATWFTYDTDGSGMWLVMSNGVETAPHHYAGDLYRTTAPGSFSSQPFVPISQSNYTLVGHLDVSFTDPDSGIMNYTVNGVTATKNLARYTYVANPPKCTLGGDPGATPNYQDLWWVPNAVESGWGVNLTHQGDVIFATWFTYGAGGKGLWIVGSNMSKTDNGVYSGVLQTTTGPNPFSNTVPFDPLKVTRTTVGDATFTFSDVNNGTFRYTVNGITQTKNITRLVFAAGPVTVCK